MARAYHEPDASHAELDAQSGDWQALRGELVALLDQVEGRFNRTETREPAISGLTSRVRSLREQVVGPEPATRRTEALRTVKRAVDRFSDRSGEADAVTDAIAEIRGRQMSGPAAALGRRAADMPEFRELSALVGGLNGRLERLEVDLKDDRASQGNVHEVAEQVEQLTHVVELLAGAVGETGQVKRLETQIAALADLVEQGNKGDVATINRRLDDVSATVGKLAELQAKQMEREIRREDAAAQPAPATDPAEILEPVMGAIENSVRNVYDRIDAIERNVALSSGEFERLTNEMAAFTQAMRERDAQPSKLVARVDALAARIGDFETSNGDIVGLRDDIGALREAVMLGMEPRFQRIEDQISALADRIVEPADTSAVESQLKRLMQRMDETGAQLDSLAQLYANQPDVADFEAMATIVAERTSDAIARKAPAPVAMFGPDSLKSIETQITGLLKSASKGPDYERLAKLVAAKTSEAVAHAVPAQASELSQHSMDAFEERMTALFNTAGRDTAERLQRLEAAIEERHERQQRQDRQPRNAAPAAAPRAETRAEQPIAPAPMQVPRPPQDEEGSERLDAMLAALSSINGKRPADSMPANPAEEAPLVDAGFASVAPVQVEEAIAAEPAIQSAPVFDPTLAERPPRPQSSFAAAEAPLFGGAAPAVEPASAAETSSSSGSTSSFVAAARRAQRAKQEPEPTKGGWGLGRMKPAAKAAEDKPAAPKKPVSEKPAKPVKESRAERKAKAAAAKAEAAMVSEPVAAAPAASSALTEQSFLTRHRRPLLLAATLVAVSVLALNLVMQRMGPARNAASPTAVTQDAEPAVVPAPDAATQPVETTPAASNDVSVMMPAGADAMVDAIATASIRPNMAMSAAKPVTATPMPPMLLASTAGSKPIDLPSLDTPATPADPATTASIPDSTAEAEVPFAPLPDAVGPEELRVAATDGDAKAQFEIGAIYTEGRAVEQDYAQAAKWYERAAAQGFVPAEYRLGNLYELGQGVEKDFELARLWYQRAADADNRMAMHNLAALYASGSLGEQDFDNAALWFEKAAARGMTDSQFNLGMLYARGLGVGQDFETSYKWFSLAANRGDQDAAKARDDVAKSLTAEAVSRLDAEIKTWKADDIDLVANFAPIGTWSEKFEPGEAIGSREVVSKVQEALTRLGYDVGVPDGIPGPKTAEAIKAFERGTGMSETGVVNPRLLAVLGSQPV